MHCTAAPLRPLLAATASLPSIVLALVAPAVAQVNVAVGDLPSDGTITLEIVVAVPNPAPAGVDVFSTQGTVSGANFADVDTDDPDAGGAADPTLTSLDALPDLTLTKSYSGPTPQPGDTLAFDLDFANAGNQGATGVTIHETVPTDTTFNAGASSAGWSCADGSPEGTPCDLLIGALAGGGAGGSAVFAVDLDDPLPPSTTEVLNTASIADDGANGADPVPDDNSDTEIVSLDAEPPTVTGVDSDPSTPDGELSECESVNLGVRALRVSFSEEVQDLPDDADSGGVTNPENYLLVAAGPNFGYDTFACGGAGGDDVEVPLAGVSYDAVTDTATLDLGGVLADDLYRLLVCDTILDSAGNPLDGDGDGTAGGDFVRSFRADRDNLFSNGHFDCDRSDWVSSSSAGATQAHDPVVDADDSPDSGAAAISVLVAGGQSESAGIGQCVELYPGDLELSGRMRLDTASLVSLTLRCDFWSQPACTADPLETQVGATALGDTGGAFTELARSLRAPGSARSAECSFVWAAGAGVTFDAWLDALHLSGPIFADGFESGDTSAWSGAEP